MTEKPKKVFEVKDGKFWVLEVTIASEKEDKKQIYVFGEENEAISRVVQYLQGEREITEETARKYNLQQITIQSEKYEVVPVSWFKVLAVFASVKVRKDEQ